MKKLFFSVLFILHFSVIFGQTDSIPVLNPLKYLDIGIGASLPDGYNALNAGLSLDVNDLLALFIEYNLFFDHQKVHLHETNIKIGPYARFSRLSFVTLAGGFSFMFNPTLDKEGPSQPGENYLFNIPLQLKFNLGMSERLAIGIKGNYNIMVTENAQDKGSALVYLAYKLRDWE